MREQVVLTGMVIKSAPAGEYDRRLVILTCERGKITAFARGARRPGSTLMASSAPFVFGTFSLYEGRDAYSLVSVEVQNYFREITENMEAACYGSYFLEFADYYGRENLEAVETLKLLYQSLRALLKSTIPNRIPNSRIAVMTSTRVKPPLLFSICKNLLHDRLIRPKTGYRTITVFHRLFHIGSGFHKLLPADLQMDLCGCCIFRISCQAFHFCACCGKFPALFDHAGIP